MASPSVPDVAPTAFFQRGRSLVLAVEHAAVEREVGLDEGGREEAGGPVERPDAGVRLPVLERDLGHEAVEAGEERRLPHDHGVERGREPDRLGHHAEVEVRVVGDEVGDGHRVVAGLGVAVLDPRPLVLGELRLEVEDGPGRLGAAVPAGEVVERLDVGRGSRRGRRRSGPRGSSSGRGARCRTATARTRGGSSPSRRRSRSRPPGTGRRSSCSGRSTGRGPRRRPRRRSGRSRAGAGRCRATRRGPSPCTPCSSRRSSGRRGRRRCRRRRPR